MKRIDSHQHFWNYSAAEYGWIEKGSRIEQSFEPKHLKPLLEQVGIDSCIAVQARQSVAENDYLCSLAQQNDFIAGVVGWIDLQSVDVVEQALKFSEQPKAVGVRHVVQGESDPNFMARPAFRAGIRSLHALGLVYDILIFENQLDDAIALAKAFPNQPFVVDHIAKPKIVQGLMEPWAKNIQILSQLPNVTIKISGMVTEADHRSWTADHLFPYWRHVADCFTPERLMFGSDWPVVKLATDYTQWFQLVDKWTADWSQSDRESLFGRTAATIYGLGD